MRLVMFAHDGERRLGVLRDGQEDEVVDVASSSPGAPGDLLALIDAGPAGLEQVAAAARAAASVHALRDLRVLAPLDPPRGNVIALGRNYAKHAEEGARVRGFEITAPTIFSKAITSICGPYDDIPIDASVSDQIDWEVELGVIIGRAGKNIRREDALGHVFGYTVLNDVSARDIQNGWGGQYFKGKSLDASCPTGPIVVTADEIPDPQDLHLQLRVNGTVKQDASTRDMIYAVDAMIEWITKGMTILPGALIATGTPEGVGFARTPPEFLHPGDVMETEVSSIGVMRNRFVAE